MSRGPRSMGIVAMTMLFSELQRAALRALDEGPQSAAHFHGRTLSSLLSYDLISLEDGRIFLTARGAHVVATVVRVQPQPTGALSRECAPPPRPLAPSPAELPPPVADDMLVVCCESLETAVAAGVLVGGRGRVYIRSDMRWWSISFCPWCGEKRA